MLTVSTSKLTEIFLSYFRKVQLKHFFVRPSKTENGRQRIGLVAPRERGFGNF
jgi:hypothetical protein